MLHVAVRCVCVWEGGVCVWEGECVCGRVCVCVRAYH